ncbi:MAG: GxxExxY protein [Planctomycetia bacterium]|nr:GxxExxY protein [Planctomycetia bacterium]
MNHEEITEQIIGAAFEVHNALGYGFLESVYQHAMQVELIARGFKAELESQIFVYFKNVQVGHFEADVLVNDCVIVEIKTAKNYCPQDEPQLLNELRATGIKVGVLINFGRLKVEFKRFAY